jgi:hypothetical protein
MSLLLIAQWMEQVLTTHEREWRNPVSGLWTVVHCKKRLVSFPSPGGMSLTKLSLAENNLIIPGQGEVG